MTFEITLPAQARGEHGEITDPRLLAFMRECVVTAEKEGLTWVSNSFKTLPDGSFWYKEVWK